MGRWLLAALLVLLAGCGTFTGTVAGDPGRDTLGVAVDQPSSESAVMPASSRKLAYKESQICTRGYVPLKQDIEPAENGRALVDWQFRCKQYQFGLPGLDLTGLVKY